MRDKTQLTPDTKFYVVAGHLSRWFVEQLMRQYRERKSKS